VVYAKKQGFIFHYNFEMNMHASVRVRKYLPNTVSLKENE